MSNTRQDVECVKMGKLPQLDRRIKKDNREMDPIHGCQPILSPSCTGAGNAHPSVSTVSLQGICLVDDRLIVFGVVRGKSIFGKWIGLCLDGTVKFTWCWMFLIFTLHNITSQVVFAVVRAGMY